MILPKIFADYEKRYPDGKKSAKFKKANVELFGPYCQREGVIESVTVFHDYEYAEPAKVYKKLLHRADRLNKSESDLKLGTITDFYSRGRPDFVKCVS